MMEFVINTGIILDIIDLYKNNITEPRNSFDVNLFKLKNMIEQGEITPIITPTIMREISYGSKFDRGFGEAYTNRYFTEIPFTEYMSDKSLLMADGYGNYLINQEFPAIPEAEDYLCKNYNKARIVGEVAVLEKKLGKVIPFITHNSDGVFDFRKINYINERNNIPELHIHTLKGLGHAINIAKSSKQDKSNN